MESLNLIWQTHAGGQTGFEQEYITRVLFGDFSLQNYFDDCAYRTVVDKAVIIYSCDRQEVDPDFIHYLNKFVKQKFTFLLLHLSNENLQHNCWYYAKANYVFRSYFDPGIKMSNVFFLPLGFQSGYYNNSHEIMPCDSRDINVTFIGQPKSDRVEMLTQLKTAGSFFTHETKTWDCDTALTILQCIEVYKKTKYAPCPMGNAHQDSFRLFEVLEWGCVPILKRLHFGVDYLTPVFGNHRLPTVDDWAEIKGIVEQGNFCELMEETQEWYVDFKVQLANRIETIVNTGGIKNNRRLLGYYDLKTFAHRKYRVLKSVLRKLS